MLIVHWLKNLTDFKMASFIVSAASSVYKKSNEVQIIGDRTFGDNYALII